MNLGVGHESESTDRGESNIWPPLGAMNLGMGPRGCVGGVGGSDSRLTLRFLWWWVRKTASHTRPRTALDRRGAACWWWLVAGPHAMGPPRPWAARKRCGPTFKPPTARHSLEQSLEGVGVASRPGTHLWRPCCQQGMREKWQRIHRSWPGRLALHWPWLVGGPVG